MADILHRLRRSRPSLVAVSTMCSGWNTISEMSLVSNPQSQKSHAFCDESIVLWDLKASHAPVPALFQNAILNPAERGMLPVLDFDPAIEPADAIDAVAVLGDHPFQPHQAGVAKQIRADLTLLEVRRWMPSTRRARSRARLVLLIESGSLRRSSPSLTNMSKA